MNRDTWTRFSCIFLLLLIITSLASGQKSHDPKSITITVTDPSNAVVAHTRVKLQAAMVGFPTILQTSEAGVLTARLMPGTYTISVIGLGFDPKLIQFKVAEDTRRITIVSQPEKTSQIVRGGDHAMIDTGSDLPKTQQRGTRTPPRVPVVVKIKVIDPGNAPIPGAQFQITQHGEGKAGKVDPDGTFSLALTPGEYDLAVTEQGFRRWEKTVQIAGDEQQIEVVLHVASYSGPVVVEPAPK